VWINERGEPGEAKIAEPELPFSQMRPQPPPEGEGDA
jgi:hypothetical protein